MIRQFIFGIMITVSITHSSGNSRGMRSSKYNVDPVLHNIWTATVVNTIVVLSTSLIIYLVIIYVWYIFDIVIIYLFIIPAQEEIQNYDIYLSASPEDEDQHFAEMIYQKLRKQKFTVFFSGHHNIIGRPLADDVVQMIKDKCTKTLIILSDSYNRDEKCTYEARMAHMKSLGKSIYNAFQNSIIHLLFLL